MYEQETSLNSLKSTQVDIHQHSRLALSKLERTVQEFYDTGLVPSMKVTYRSGQKFVQFCVNYDIQNILPVNQELLCVILGEGGAG